MKLHLSNSWFAASLAVVSALPSTAYGKGYLRSGNSTNEGGIPAIATDQQQRGLIFLTPLQDLGGTPTNLPLGSCQGDCDRSSDCEGDLVCYQRDGYDDVPGECIGEGVKDHDYCVLPIQNGLPVLDWVGHSSPDGSLLEVCQGDCDRSSECAGDLVCYQRDGYDAIPGCFGKGVKNHDYCVHPVHEDLPVLDWVGHSSPDGSLLKFCQGDCDSDAECEEGLECFERSGYDAIPGCFGKGVEKHGYCVHRVPKCRVPTLLDVEGIVGKICPDGERPWDANWRGWTFEYCVSQETCTFGNNKPGYGGPFSVGADETQICSDGTSPPCKAPAPIQLSGDENRLICHDGIKNAIGGGRCMDSDLQGGFFPRRAGVCPDGWSFCTFERSYCHNLGPERKPEWICPDGSLPE